MSALDELSAAARTVAANTTVAVVGIGRAGRPDGPPGGDHGAGRHEGRHEGRRGPGPSRGGERSGSRGSGLVIAQGKVLTSAHNLRDRTTSVTFSDGRVAQGEVAGVDPDGDVVVLTVDTGSVAALQLASSEANVGDIVFSVASGGHVTFGMISAAGRAFRGPRGRFVRGAIEHTAPVPRGGSGGALLNLAGEVIGINTHRLEGGFYLAVPTDADLQGRIARMAAGEVIERRRLGVALVPMHAATRIRAAAGLPEQPGVLIRGVGDDTPAARAGLRRGDVITAVADQPVQDPDQLAELLEATSADTVTLSVVRGVDALTITVDFAQP